MATKKGIALSAVAGIPSTVISRLAEFWITTAEELVSAARQDGGLQGLATITGLSVDEITRVVEQAQSALPPEVSFAIGEPQVHGLGALDEHEPGEEGEAPTAYAILPDSANLTSHFGPVRDQGQRGTCVAHACTAVREYLLGKNSTQSNFSEQFLYWACKRVDMMPSGGTFIRVAMDRLQVEGIPAEAIWPYNPAQIDNNEGQDPPPAGAANKALPNRIEAFASLTPNNVNALRQALAAGSPIAFSVPVYTSWFTEPTHSSGDIRMPLPGEQQEGGHAMCMTGYEVDPDVPGGGYFMIRNSWGTTWGCDNPIAPGYARMPFAYIAQYGNSAYTARIRPDKPWQRFIGSIRQRLGIG
jgi:hypothetical protein